MKLQLLTSLSLLMIPTITMAGGDQWMVDFSAAKSKAAKENKSLLVDFTGSDWCGWCIKLNEEVFDHDAFKESVAKKFILVELDYPKDDSKLSEKTKKQNAELKDLYQIQGFPTILLMDAQGRPFAQTGYQAGGPDSYVAHLDDLLKDGTTIKTSLDTASKLEGVKKAEAYVTALSLVSEAHISHYQSVVDQIPTLDPEDTTGFIAKIKFNEDLVKLESSIQALFGSEKANQAPAMIDQFIANHKLDANQRKDLETTKLRIQMTIADQAGDTDLLIKHIDDYITDKKVAGEEKQEVLSMKVSALIKAKRFDDVAKLTDEIITISPDSEIGQMASGFKTNQLPQMIKQTEEPAKDDSNEEVKKGP